MLTDFLSICLNPCFSGICSLSFDIDGVKAAVIVLILVLVEYAL